MRKMKLSSEDITAFVLTVVLLCMSAAVVYMNENYTMHVLAGAKEDTQTEGKSDTEKPTLNAAVSEGMLSVQVHDQGSGVKAVYVNGYEFTDLTDGTLNVRLQQFDAGYEYFTIYATDNAGNRSENYQTKNPYYKSASDTGSENLAGQLPESAKPTKTGSATGTVTEHTKTETAEEPGKEKEFYTIQTATDKVFYLIIEQNGEEEMVYFLTEITENDLLNVTSDNSATLPKNSAALESAIPNDESALPNNHDGQPDTAGGQPEPEGMEDAESPEETKPEPEAAEESAPMLSYLLMGGLAVIVIGGAYYFKVVRRKNEDFIEDEDEEDNEEYENEDEESEEDFFDGQEE